MVAEGAHGFCFFFFIIIFCCIQRCISREFIGSEAAWIWILYAMLALKFTDLPAMPQGWYSGNLFLHNSPLTHISQTRVNMTAKVIFLSVDPCSTIVRWNTYSPFWLADCCLLVYKHLAPQSYLRQVNRWLSGLCFYVSKHRPRSLQCQLFHDFAGCLEGSSFSWFNVCLLVMASLLVQSWLLKSQGM